MPEKLTIVFDFIYDEERMRETHAAGAYGARAYPEGRPSDPWAFEVFGFPSQTEALEKANYEVQRRLRIGWLPGKDA